MEINSIGITVLARPDPVIAEGFQMQFTLSSIKFP